ncbi:MAG: AraC family ligand binding domain-containing protein, partial [Clostridia bacterium]|nr:AraC family ligand binding domain-containing protein [Clostridia bacterium]
MDSAILQNKKYKTLNVRYFGHEACKPGHSYTHAYIDFYLIHYVATGCGTICYEGKSHNVQKGEIFIIKPGGVYQ